MNTLLIVVVVVFLAELIIAFWLFRSTRSMVQSHLNNAKLEDRFILENIVHVRSSLRLISSVGVLLITFLAFTGNNAVQNIERNVSESVTKEIKELSEVDLKRAKAASEQIQNIAGEIKTQAKDIKATSEQVNRINVESLKAKAAIIDRIEDAVQRSGSQFGKYLSTFQSRYGLLYDSLQRDYAKFKQSPQKLFVVESLAVKQGTTGFSFADLRPIGDVRIPKLSEPPVISGSGYRGNMGLGMDTKQTKDSIYIYLVESGYVNLWIYIK
jgi:hypothetical protein